MVQGKIRTIPYLLLFILIVYMSTFVLHAKGIDRKSRVDSENGPVQSGEKASYVFKELYYETSGKQTAESPLERKTLTGNSGSLPLQFKTTWPENNYVLAKGTLNYNFPSAVTSTILNGKEMEYGDAPVSGNAVITFENKGIPVVVKGDLMIQAGMDYHRAKPDEEYEPMFSFNSTNEVRTELKNIGNESKTLPGLKIDHTFEKIWFTSDYIYLRIYVEFGETGWFMRGYSLIAKYELRSADTEPDLATIIRRNLKRENIKGDGDTVPAQIASDRERILKESTTESGAGKIRDILLNEKTDCYLYWFRQIRARVLDEVTYGIGAYWLPPSWSRVKLRQNLENSLP